MSLTVNAKTYANDNPLSVNAARYLGPGNSLESKDRLDVKRTPAKPTETSLGNARGQVKLTRTLTDGTDALPSDSLWDFQWRFPVEGAGAEIDACIDDLAAFVASATFKTIVKNQTINHE